MNKKELLENAKSLRRNMTRQEKHLWYDFLKGYPIKIYKQRIIDNFIADFYCHKAKLIIEIDGSQHYTPEGKEYDNFRTEILNQHGLFVLRFTNGDIDNHFEGVCYFIDKTIKQRMNLSPADAGALLGGEPN
nr:endonuclease domain-containing protein [Oscillospiraceae bacterium]